jgi:hypothetical protein
MSDEADRPGPDARGAPEHHRPRSQVIQNWLIGAALLAELVALVGHPLFGWGTAAYTATPAPLVFQPPVAPSGSNLLLTLADVAARQPASAATGQARYAFVRRRTWSVSSGPAAKPSPQIHSTVIESWLRADGTGRVLAVTGSRAGPITRAVFLHTGPPLTPLTADAPALASRLGLGYPVPTPAGEQFAEVGDVTARQPVTGAVQATVLRLLARLPALIDSGTVVDRAGRPGIAVSVDSAYLNVPARFTLIFDGGTGRLQEEDVTLTGDPGGLRVRPGAVVSYTTFLASGWVAGTGAVP